MRTKREYSIETAINRFEKAGWDIKCEKDASEFISEYAGDELNIWIENNVDVWERLNVYHEGLKQLRFGEKNDWKF